MPLYHRQVHGLPPLTLNRLSDLKISDHAVARATERATENRVPVAPLLAILKSFDPTTYPVFQVETIPSLGGGERVVKINYRKRLNARLDLCACINPVEGSVLTCWVQYNTFRPFINRSAYAYPPKVASAKPFGPAI